MLIKHRNEIYDIAIEKNDNSVFLNINGEKQEYIINQVNKNIFIIKNDGRNLTGYLAEDELHYYVVIDGRSFTFDKVNEEEKDFDTDSNSSTSNKQIVKPPMPGNIVKVIAEKDQSVSEGDPLIIVEAMKMETSIYASIDGVVTEINVNAGEQVDTEKILLVVERKDN
jgi:biotin carboxyl carrier protein